MTNNIPNVSDRRRDHETTALMWLKVAQACDGSQVGSRELALALASLAMDCADASVINVG